jgi:hypothetical protein
LGESGIQIAPDLQLREEQAPVIGSTVGIGHAISERSRPAIRSSLDGARLLEQIRPTSL